MAGRIKKIFTSKSDPNYVTVMSDKYICLYDLSSSVKEDSFNRSSTIDQMSADLNSNDVNSKNIRDIFMFKLTNSSYDYIFDMELNDEFLQESWVSIYCKEFSQLHIMKLGELKHLQEKMEEEQDLSNQKMVLGGNFFMAEQEIKVEVDIPEK